MTNEAVAWHQRAKAVARAVLEDYDYTPRHRIDDVTDAVQSEIAAEMVSEFGGIDALHGALDGEELSLTSALRVSLISGEHDAAGHQLCRCLKAWARPWIEAALHDIPSLDPSIQTETAARDYQQRVEDLKAETRG